MSVSTTGAEHRSDSPIPRPPGRPAPSDDLRELRRSLTELAGRTGAEVGPVDGLGITVRFGGGLVFAGSNPFARAVDEVQYGVLEGPCLLAQLSGSEVRSDQIGAGEPRWPRFTPRAAALDLRSVVSTPLVTAGRTTGSLNLYGTAPDRFHALEPASVHRLAVQVEHELGAAVWTGVTQANARWFARAVRDRTDVDRAVGALTSRYRISVAEAYVLVAQLALEDGVSEADAARAVLDEDPPG